MAKRRLEFFDQVKARLDSVRLSRREREMVELLVKGCSTPRMAAALGVTVSTVHTYLKRIFSRLGVHSRVELIAWATGGEQGAKLTGRRSMTLDETDVETAESPRDAVMADGQTAAKDWFLPKLRRGLRGQMVASVTAVNGQVRISFKNGATLLVPRARLVATLPPSQEEMAAAGA